MKFKTKRTIVQMGYETKILIHFLIPGGKKSGCVNKNKTEIV